MKQFWVDIRPWNKEIATTAIESGADALVVDRAEDVRGLGRITTVAPDGDLVPGKDVVECTITDKASENKAAAQGKHTLVIVATSDWTVIPLENLVAQSDKIIALVKDEKDARMALHVLEKGTHGILLKTDSPAIVGVEARRWYTPTLDMHPAFASLPREGSLKRAHTLASEILCLPFHLHMTDADVDEVCEVFEWAAQRNRKSRVVAFPVKQSRPSVYDLNGYDPRGAA